MTAARKETRTVRIPMCSGHCSTARNPALRHCQTVMGVTGNTTTAAS